MESFSNPQIAGVLIALFVAVYGIMEAIDRGSDRLTANLTKEEN